MMNCTTNHTDPNDNPSDLHIATCYAAYEVYWDRDGLVSQDEFDAQPVTERLADIRAYGDSPLSRRTTRGWLADKLS